jgi:hypothetical protein
MKVYESSHQTKRDYSKVPQIKIKNYRLARSGFNIGKEYKVTYSPNKIVLEIVEDQKVNS